MIEKIRVVQTSVYEYIPNYDEDFYIQLNVTTLDAALKVDMESVNKGETSIDEIAEEISSTYKWEIINE